MEGKVRRRIEEDREGQQRYSNEMNKEKGAEREDDEKLRWDPLKEDVKAERGGGRAEGHVGGRRQVGSSDESEKSKREGRKSQKKERKKRRGKR